MAGYAGISLCMTGFFWAMFEALRFTTALNTGTIFVLIISFLSDPRSGGGRPLDFFFNSAWVVLLFVVVER